MWGILQQERGQVHVRELGWFVGCARVWAQEQHLSPVKILKTSLCEWILF